MKQFTINRSEWASGDYLRSHEKQSVLFDPVTKRFCCLGIYLENCNVSPADMVYVQLPSLIYDRIPPEAEWMIYEDLDSLATQFIIEINDALSLSDGEREKELIDLFRRQNIELDFVGRLHKNTSMT